MKARYDQPAEVAHAFATVDAGLWPEEDAIIREFLRQNPQYESALIVGSGAGREARALARLGFSRICAIDTSEQMSHAAREARLGPAIETKTASIDEIHGEFDLVFIANAIPGHIQGRAARIAFYRHAARLARGAVCVLPCIERLSPLRFYPWAASRLLRAKWRSGRLAWEEGDSVRSFFGSHNTDFRPVFFHYYPTRPAFEAEIFEAGLKIAACTEDAYLLNRRAR